MPRLPALLIFLFLSTPVFSNTVHQLQTELNQKQYGRAAKTGLAMLRTQPGDVQVQFLTAVAFQHNNQVDVAQRYYRQIILNHPELPEPKNNLAMIHMAQGQYDQAIELLIASMKTHPAYATAWQNLNLLYQGLASEAYRKALSKEKNPQSVMNRIQLTSLSRLYDASSLTEAQKTKPAKPLVLAAAVAVPVKKLDNPVKPVKNTNDVLIETLKNWSNAWSQKQFGSYINAYSANYSGDRTSHQAWVDYRRSRILKPGTIKVGLTNFKIKSVSESLAIIDFHQSFESPTYRDKVVKRIHLKKINNNWKISRESTVAVL